MAEDDDSKTEEPTGRRLSKAREEGDLMQSQEVKTAIMLFGITIVVWVILPFMMIRLQETLSGFLERSYATRILTVDDLVNMLLRLAVQSGILLALPLFFLMALGLISATSQVGWNFTPTKLIPDLNKINPLNGLQRMFSLQSVMELCKSIAKLGVVGAVCWTYLRPHVRDLPNLASLSPMGILAYLHNLVSHLLLGIVLTVVVIAAADWLYQRYAYNKKLRMTKQEVKDEHKQTEGDPMIKSRIRSLRMQRARQRMMAAVPKSDVVVTNPTHFACALKYDQESMEAPILVAKGKELMALRIRQIAEENGVPIVENPPLARALYANVEIDREIPPEHYKAVAEVISYVYKLKGKKRA